MGSLVAEFARLFQDQVEDHNLDEAGNWIPKKKRQKKTTNSVMKPFPDEEGKKVSEEPPEDQENKVARSPLAQLMRLKEGVNHRLHEMNETMESSDPISMFLMRARIDNLDDAWFEFLRQHKKLRIISGRGRLFGLKAYYSDLHKWYLGYKMGWQRILDEE